MSFTSGERSPRLDALEVAHDLVARGIDHAIAKHGPNATDMLPLHHKSSELMLSTASSVGYFARMAIESGCPDQVAVLLEEVGEFADAVLSGGDWRSEVIQVAAVATMIAAEEEADDV